MSIAAVQARTTNYQHLWKTGSAPAPTFQPAPGESPSASDAEKAGPVSPPLLAASDRMLMQGRHVSDAESQAYEHLLTRFAADQRQGGDPLAFLKTLSQDGLDLLKKVHSFPAGMTVDLASMDREAAINFVVPDSRQVDLDNDGLIGSANGTKAFRFPPVNAPQAVKDAWAEATEGLSDRDRMLSEGMFLSLVVTVNLTYDTAGNPVGIMDPDDQNFVNPFADPGFSYPKIVDNKLANLERFKAQYSVESYERGTRVLTAFAEALERNGVT